MDIKQTAPGLKRILLCTDGSAFSKVCYEYTAWFAKRLQAQVKILYVSAPTKPAAPAHRNLTGSIGVGAYTELLDRLVEDEHESAKLEHEHSKFVLREAKAFFQSEGLADTVTFHQVGTLTDSLRELEAECDWVVLDKCGEACGLSAGSLDPNLEQVVRSSAKPCLITPCEFRAIENVLFVDDGHHNCREALAFLSKSSVCAGLNVHVVALEKSDREMAATSRLESTTQILKASDFVPQTRVLHGASKAQLAKYVEQYRIDLMLLGSYDHNRIREFLRGNTTAQMLNHTEIPILVFH